MRWAAYKTSFEFRVTGSGLNRLQNPSTYRISPTEPPKQVSKANLKLGTGNSEQVPVLASHMCVGALTGGIPSRIAIIRCDVRNKS